MRGISFARPCSVVIVLLAATVGCRSTRPVVSVEPPASQPVEVRFDPPRPLPGAPGMVRAVRGSAHHVTSDSIVLEPREIRSVDGATVRLSGAQPAISIARDASVTITTSRFSAGRTAGLILFLAAGAALVTVLVNVLGDTADGY